MKLSLCLGLLVAVTATAQDSYPAKDWLTYHGDYRAQRYSSLASINRDTVRTGSAAKSVSAASVSSERRPLRPGTTANADVFVQRRTLRTNTASHASVQRRKLLTRRSLRKRRCLRAGRILSPLCGCHARTALTVPRSIDNSSAQNIQDDADGASTSNGIRKCLIRKLSSFISRRRRFSIPARGIRGRGRRHGLRPLRRPW